MQITQIVALLALTLPVLADGAVERRYVGGPANAAALVAARAPRKDSGRILANDPSKQKEQDAITAALDAENNPQPPANAARILGGGGRKKNQKRSPEPKKDSGRILANDPSKQAEQDAITAALDAENNPQPPANAARILEGGKKKKAN